MQIVAQTKKRSGWRVYRTLAALGVPRSVYYAWKGRESLVDEIGQAVPGVRGAARGTLGDL